MCILSTKYNALQSLNFAKPKFLQIFRKEDGSVVEDQNLVISLADLVFSERPEDLAWLRTHHLTIPGARLARYLENAERPVPDAQDVCLMGPDFDEIEAYIPSSS